MPTKSQRTDSLSKERIVSVAIDILDADGEAALTFRALAARLSTGSGAIYWHVANKAELLAAASEDVITRALTEMSDGTEPRESIRTIALEVFDAIDVHPWIGTQLSREPWQSAMVHIFEGIGSQLQALEVPDRSLLDSASALVNYILGVAGQNAANARLHGADSDRSTFLTAVADRWAQLDPEKYPFMQRLASQLPEHDDREQFLAGINYILAGIPSAR